ncbi:metal-sensing transcriptional repressor [Anaerococcus sp. AGMB00486]|uniref:Copper-sensing transcriptional repressor CsoR n=1 Tax=Anaerococcus faecalis TaxID=2742993 RepID=A0ABX2N6W7_9FIRM|nr:MULTISPECIES: metal-sensing transcriptional repressor [Anaerococcus]MDY3005983.1 metal-sensing transcriptional repressor [Anaerococcus porci]NVF10429.1 metal-sensing transcriptional repressor [Anaerococcus faecalis]
MQANKDKTLRKLKTVRGQLDGIIKMVEDDRYCIDISNQIMASISILKNINTEVLSSHLEHCVYDAVNKGSTEDGIEKIEEIEQVIKKLSK